MNKLLSFNHQGKEEEFARAHQSRRDALSKEAPVSIARVLATKNDLLVVEKTSSESVRKQTQSSVNKVIIGKVPMYIMLALVIRGRVYIHCEHPWNRRKCPG